MDLLVAVDQSIPASASTRIVYGLTPLGSVPAESTAKSGPPICRRSASAIWLRAELPVHTNRTRIGSPDAAWAPVTG